MTVPPLAEVQALAQQAAAEYAARVEAQSKREIATSQVAMSAGPLLDWLQLALGVLVLTRFERQVSPALAEWGFNIIEKRRRQRRPRVSRSCASRGWSLSQASAWERRRSTSPLSRSP